MTGYTSFMNGPSPTVQTLTVEAVDVSVAEHGGGEAGAVGAGRLLVGADGLVRVEERLEGQFHC